MWNENIRMTCHQIWGLRLRRRLARSTAADPNRTKVNGWLWLKYVNEKQQISTKHDYMLSYHVITIAFHSRADDYSFSHIVLIDVSLSQTLKNNGETIRMCFTIKRKFNCLNLGNHQIYQKLCLQRKHLRIKDLPI